MMHDIRKKIVTDEDAHPVAVQIDYADWLRIERLLRLMPDSKKPTNLAQHLGRLSWPVDRLEYQRRVRNEWRRTTSSIPRP